MKPTYKSIALVSLISLSLSVSVPLLADPGAPGADPSVGATSSQNVGSSGVPLDGGVLEILLAGAAVAGFGKARGLQRAKSKEQGARGKHRA